MMSTMNDDERERRAAVHEWRARYDSDAAPIVQELRDAAFAVESISDLYNKKLSYERAIPILVAWLPCSTSPIVKEEIVRALSVKWARNTPASKALVDEFERAEGPTADGLRWAIGNSLEVLANDEIADEMIEVATDRRYGKAREMVVVGLGKLKDARVTDVLLKLLDDDEVVGHAVMALGRLRARAARSRIESLLNHPKPWIRKEVKKALSSIDKAP
jgi:HEAT repeat protein